MRSTCRWMALAACLAAACGDGARDPGPFDIDGWIGQCEDRCEQQSSCEPEEFLFYHGDMDNCLRDCPYYLERDENVAFVEETPDVCLEALYAQVKCVFHMSCDDLGSWDVNNSYSHCGEETAAAEEACAGIDAADFLADCGWPQDEETDI